MSEQDRQPPDSSVVAPDNDHSYIEDVQEEFPEDAQLAEMMSHTIDVPVLAEVVESREAADAADILENLHDHDAVDVLTRMDHQAAADALSEMQIPLAISALTDLVHDDAPYAVTLLGLMAPDDAADLLQGFDESQRQRLLAAMPSKTARGLRRLVGYDEESAGGIMTTDFLALYDDMTVSEATELIRATQISEDVQHALVTTRDRTLDGVVGLRKLLVAKPKEIVSDVMSKSIKAIRPEIDREAVAREFDRYDYAMLPVIDRSDRLIGIVTVDDVIDIIRQEQTEDVQKTVGAGGGEAVYSTLSVKFKGRFPWLGLSMVMSCLAAAVVLIFQDLIEEHTILAFLLPVIAALVGNAGHQALAVTLRGIVLEEVRRERIWPLVGRESLVGGLMGIGIGVMIILFLGTLTMLNVENATWSIGIVAGVAAMAAMSVGTLAGSCIPLAMRHFGIDPAQSSAIFLIMITDAISFSALLGLTALMIQ